MQTPSFVPADYIAFTELPGTTGRVIGVSIFAETRRDADGIHGFTAVSVDYADDYSADFISEYYLNLAHEQEMHLDALKREVK